jgi:hypothetical protein
LSFTDFDFTAFFGTDAAIAVPPAMTRKTDSVDITFA